MIPLAGFKEETAVKKWYPVHLGKGEIEIEIKTSFSLSPCEPFINEEVSRTLIQKAREKVKITKFPSNVIKNVIIFSFF